MKKHNKIVSLITGMGLSMILCLSAYGAESSEESQFDLILEKYNITHEEIIRELEHSKKNATEVFQLMQEILRINELMNKNIKRPDLAKKYSTRKEELSNSVHEKYGLAFLATSIHLPKSDLEKDSIKTIEKNIGETIALYKNTRSCFNNKAYTDSYACNDFAKICNNYGSDNGDMYYYELSKDLELKKIDVSDNDAYLFRTRLYKGQETFIKNAYHFCRLLSQTKHPFTPEVIRKQDEQMDFDFIKGFYGSVLPFPLKFQEICIDGTPSEGRVSRLINLKTRFPDDWTIQFLYDSYSKWKPACNKAAQIMCENSYVLKDKIILTYETVACKNREVTREDIENDIRWMDSHADKLKHSTLLDKIDICQKASDSGFSWLYQEPTRAEECKKENTQPKKRK